MATRWLMGFLSPTQGAITMAEPDQPARTFHHFQALPAELRLQIWQYYFDVPRIHVLYRGPSKSLDEASVAYDDLTAQTNRSMPASLRFAAAVISHEALFVFQKTFDLVHMDFMSLPSKHVRDIFDDRLRSLGDATTPDKTLGLSTEILRSRPDMTAFIKNLSGKPPATIIPGVHINWESDMLYFTDGADVNCEMLRRACNGPIASKLRRVAILIHDSYNFEGWRPFYGPSVDFPKSSANPVEVVLVVRIKDIEPSIYATMERDEFGFVQYDSVYQGQQKDTWVWMQNMKLVERRFMYVTQLLGEAFPDLESQKIKRAVDVDYMHHEAKTRYSRKPR
ncbi:hypothetical protein F4777DRAFT_589742 [Nemania sp. FL0916]|nr:hypothetical protein F4777DRAFT_589742 [Nemania sp. FL0916]